MDGFCDDTASESEDKAHVNNSISEDSAINIDNLTDENCVKSLLANASSIMPKIDSLVDAFNSLNHHFECITETWYKGGAALKDHLTDLEGASGIRVLHRSRDSRLKKRGGGVAIAFNISSCNFKQRQLNSIEKHHEIVCALGRIGKIAKPIAIFCIYVPPSIKQCSWRNLRRH